jgi:ankyrin repeat domain-containing protein 50
MEALRNAVFLTWETLDKLPAKIEDLYSDTVRRIMGQSEEQRKIAGRVLMWLLYAARPLSMTELYSAVASDPDSESWKYEGNEGGDERSLVSVCCGLVTVEKESGLVCLVREFDLQSRRTIFD